MSDVVAREMPDDPAVEKALREAAAHVERTLIELEGESNAAYPVLQGSMAVTGMIVGHGLGRFVVNGMTNEQIVEHVMKIVTHIREGLGTFQS